MRSNETGVRQRKLFFSQINIAWMMLGITFVYVFSLILSDKSSWVLFETFSHEIYIVQNVPLNQIIKGVFNTQVFEYSDRLTRPLSSMFEILDTHLRAWLWHYIKPITSLSITFVFSLLLNPLLFYKFLLNLKIRRSIAVLATSLMILSPGSLSVLVMYFRPAKAMLNFWLIFCLYYASVIYLKDVGQNVLNRDDRNVYGLIGLIAVGILLAFLFDETAIVIASSLFFLFPAIYFRDYKRFLFFLSVPIMLGTLYFYIFPRCSIHFGYPKPNLLNYAPLNIDSFPPINIIVSNFIQHLWVITRESLNLLNPLYFFTVKEKLLVLSSITGIFVFICRSIVPLYKGNQKCLYQLKSFALKTAALLIFLCLVHTLLLDSTSTIGRIWGPYYYGAYFGIFFAILLALLGEMVMQAKSRTSYSFIAMMSLLCMSLMIAFPYINYVYREAHYPFRSWIIEGVFRGYINRFQFRTPDLIPGNDEVKRLWKLFKAGKTPESIHRTNLWIPIETMGKIPNNMQINDP